jgi:hypothetical protein
MIHILHRSPHTYKETHSLTMRPCAPTTCAELAAGCYREHQEEREMAHIAVLYARGELGAAPC